MDLWTEILALLSQVVTPIWDELIQYIPLLLLALVPLVMFMTLFQWRRHAARNASRVPSRLPDGRMPEGLHLPRPSLWPAVASVGVFLIFLGVVLGGADGPTFPFIVLGLGVGAIAFVGWLMDARREYDETEAGAHHLALAPEVPGRRAEHPIPEGVHLPPPSPWPFLGPIGVFFAFLGIVLGPVLIVGGAVMALIALVGWILDAGREYHEVADGAHADPAMRDPARVWPSRLVPVYVGIAAVSILLTLAPWLLTLLPKTDDTIAAGPTPTVEPYLSASSVVGFDQVELIIPADTPVTLTFDNNQEGVDHNVTIVPETGAPPFFDGEIITGVATIEYAIPPLPAGDYPYLCVVHPVTMVGTLRVV